MIMVAFEWNWADAGMITVVGVTDMTSVTALVGVESMKMGRGGPMGGFEHEV
jgi:hypothetical protein